MYKILLVDDDAINRVAIVSMLDWEKLGFQVVGTANNGKSALEFFKNHQVDLIITDMKMPIMDGLELIREIRSYNKTVSIIAISSYSDYELVRSAFKSNVDDYILKADLSSEVLAEYLLKVKLHLDKNAKILSVDERFLGVEDDKAMQKYRVYESYYTFVIDVCNYEIESKRFSEGDRNLIMQMEEVVNYIPQFAENFYISSNTRTSILLCYHTMQSTEGKLHALCRQLIQVFKNYMNIKVFIGVSDWNQGEVVLQESIELAMARYTFSYVYGKQQIFINNQCGILELSELDKELYCGIVESLKKLDEESLFEEQTKLFNDALFTNEVELKKKCLELIYFEGMMLNETGDSIWNVWGDTIDFGDKIERLQGSSSVVMWIANYNRWIMEYLRTVHEKYGGANEMVSLCHYIEDNYAKSDLSLNEVASIAGFNEKYFSSKFKKEIGVTFVDYLTNIRMEAAKNLLQKTNMKLAEISEAVGYNNVEHFVRVFKKKNGMSPREYTKSSR